MTRVALYTRVSTEDQAKEGFSLGAQLERLRAFARSQEWTVTGEYVDDGKSGRNTSRPEYQRMMQERAQWDVLLVLKMDRIHRNSKNFILMMEDLRKDGKQFASATESLDTGTAMGRFVMDIIQRIAQLESEQTGERTYVGMEQKAKEGGGSLGKPAPFGYRWDEGKLVIVPEEARIVKRIRSHKVAGWSFHFIATGLNEDGLKTRNGKPWTYWNVKAIAENLVYDGHTVWNAIPQYNTHEAIPAEVGT